MFTLQWFADGRREQFPTVELALERVAVTYPDACSEDFGKDESRPHYHVWINDGGGWWDFGLEPIAEIYLSDSEKR